MRYILRYGGSEGSFFDLVLLFEELGKVLLPSPLGSVILSRLTLNEAGDSNLKDEYLPAIIRGEKILTIGLLDERGRYDYDAPALEDDEFLDESYKISGTNYKHAKAAELEYGDSWVHRKKVAEELGI